MNNLVIVSCNRTPYALVHTTENGYESSLKNTSPIDLASNVLQRVVDDLGEAKPCALILRLGTHLSGSVELGMRQAPAKTLVRQIPGCNEVNAATFNVACNSGFSAMEDAMKEIFVGTTDLALVVGVDMPSRCTKKEVLSVLQNPDTRDMVWHYADRAAKDFGYTRDSLDEHAFRFIEQTVAHRSDPDGCIVPIVNPDGSALRSDEVSENVRFEDITTREPAKKCERITSLHLCRNADGAGALALATEEAATRYGLPIMARILSLEFASGVFDEYTVIGEKSTQKALAVAGLRAKDIDVFFVEQTSVTTVLHFGETFRIPAEKINPWGIPGHAYGATPLMLLSTLLEYMKKTKKRYGTIAIGATGAQGSTCILENMR